MCKQCLNSAKNPFARAENIVFHKCITFRKVTGKRYAIPNTPMLHDSDPLTIAGLEFSGALYVRDHAR